MSTNIQRLGDTLAGRMKKTASAAVPTTIELGLIQGNLSLVTDSLQSPIPRGDYMVAITLTDKTYRTSLETHTHEGGKHDHEFDGDGDCDGDVKHGGDHTHEDGEHDHRLPAVFRGLRAGDRVLVAWCGHEPVVISIVVGS